MKRAHITCVLCPNGCALEVHVEDPPSEDTIRVSGNLCQRGVEYALEEMVSPKRTLTTSILVRGGEERLTSVKTAQPIPQESLREVRGSLREVRLLAPVAVGDVVMSDVAGTSVVVTRSVAPRRRSPPASGDEPQQERGEQRS